MTAKESLLSRAVPLEPLPLTVHLKDRTPVRFLIPVAGAARVGYERRAEAWTKSPPNGVWVSKGLLPKEGLGEDVSALLFALMEFNAEGWTQEDVLEIFNRNPGEVIEMAGKVLKHGLQSMAGAKAAEMEAELKNSEGEATTDGS